MGMTKKLSDTPERGGACRCIKAEAKGNRRDSGAGSLKYSAWYSSGNDRDHGLW